MDKKSNEALPLYDKAKSLGKMNMDIGRITVALPCGSEGYILMCAQLEKA